MTPSLPKSIPDKLPGTVLPQYKRCGNPGCHCARGELHGPYWYRFWRDDGYTLRKQYVRKTDLEAVRAACARYRQEVREGWAVLRRGEKLLDWLAHSADDPINARQAVPLLLQATDTLRQVLEYADGQKGGLCLRIRALTVLGRYLAAHADPPLPDNTALLLAG